MIPLRFMPPCSCCDPELEASLTRVSGHLKGLSDFPGQRGRLDTRYLAAAAPTRSLWPLNATFQRFTGSALRRFGASCKQQRGHQIPQIAFRPFRGKTDTSIMLNRVYCTYFDHNYLSRGLALYHSLRRHSPGARLWVLCLSADCYRILVALGLPGIVAVRLEDFDAAEPELAATRGGRSIIEYYFTCTPAWMLFVLAREPEAEWVTYLDGDLYFFASPETIYAELQDAAVAIIPHRYAANL